MSKLPRVVSAGPRLQAKAKARRRDRRSSLLRRTSWAVAMVAPVVLLGWIVLGSPLLAVQKVVVTGEGRLSVAQITAAAAVLAVARGGSVVLLDYTAADVATVSSTPRGVFPLSSASDAATRAALSVLHGLPRGIVGRLGSLQAPSPEQVTLVLRDGRQILWGGAVDNASKATAVLALMRMPGTIFDVSAPGVVTRR